RKSQETGIEAYDCHVDEMVLLIPWIIAMLGDNPMQSEFASHIGLSGKCFCRVCNVRGADAKNRPDGAEGDRQRVTQFLSTSTPRSKDDTLTKLQAQLDHHLRGAPTTAATHATDSGVKDKYFQHFADKLADACADIKEKQRTDPSIHGRAHLVKVLAELRAQMPPDDTIFSPALRLDDFDPNTDSPVEILHVVLLGFVKYFWRDAVSRQKPEGKEILKARINSFDTSGLGLAKARGNTLVQYAGSLTGRDFRLIVQMAPAVLYGLIPDKAYEAWLALCRLAPLIFQPEITDLTSYLVSTSSSSGQNLKHPDALERNVFRMLWTIFWLQQHCGTPNGLTNRNSTSSSTLYTISAGLALLYFARPKLSSPSIMLSGLGVFIPIVRLPALTLAVLSNTCTLFGI
ncbi:hypothetical protein C8R47DRAFT_985022, partial [Mycena vitilis]